MQGPGISDLEVATLADLSDLHVAPLTDGSTCFVISENAQYRLYKNSGFSADGVTIVRPEVGSPIAGADNARWILVGGETIVQSQLTAITGAIGTENVLSGTSNPLVLLPENSTENYKVELMVRRNADGAQLYYQRDVTVTRDGAGAPSILQTDLVTHEDAAWPVGNASFPATTAVLVAGQYYLVVSFAQAGAVTTASSARATVTRNSPIAS